MWCLNSENVVLDPFVGAGTTQVACRSAGIRSTGVDLSPLAVFATRVKVSNIQAADLDEARRVLVGDVRIRSRLPGDALYDDLVVRALPGTLLPTLDGVRRAISDLNCHAETKEALTLALLAVIPRFSRLVRKGGWLEERSESMPASRVATELDRQLEIMVGDIVAPKETEVSTVVEEADARQVPMPDCSVDAVITSPPYLNRHDYTRVFGVELQFGFLNWEQLRKLRYQLMHSHPEARPVRAPHDAYVEPREVGKAVETLSKKYRGESRLPRMIRGYFEDMYLVATEITRVLKPGGRAALVLGNVSYAGIPIHVDRTTAAIGQQAGLTPEVIYAARYRGNSAQQMSAYGRRPQRESVVVLKKPLRKGD